jgi:4-hydroxy-3-polyprenylbenzoate decarboxylase
MVLYFSPKMKYFLHDGTNKSEIDGFKREWPDDVNCTKSVIEDLRKRGLIDISNEEIEYYQIV